MVRLHITIYFLVSLLVVSCKLVSGEADSDEVKVKKTSNNDQSLLHDTAALPLLRKVYGDSALTMRDSISKYFTFIRSVTDSSITGHGEFSSQSYSFLFPFKPMGWVSDFEDIYSSGEELELDSMINDFEEETSVEIAIVTLDSSWVSADRFDGFTFTIANSWGVGKKGKNNGVLIGISRGLRMIRIQNGYGIETIMSDDETKKILEEYILPEFRKGMYFQGTKRGLLAIMNELR